MTEPTTLVTGATGIVGGAIVRELVKRGRPVRVLVRSLERARALLPVECEAFAGDVTDRDSIERAMTGCRVVYHAAGLPEQWLPDDAVFQDVNVGGTRAVSEVALALGIERFVYTSTIDVFEATPGQEFDERTVATEPKGTAYERSKQDADRIVVAAMKRGLRAIFLHPSGVYGPIPAGSPGLNALLQQLMRRQIPMLLPGGTPLVYAPDVGLGHVLAERQDPGSRFILSESYWTLVDIARAVREVVPTATVPRVVPSWVAHAVAIAGTGVANVIRRPPLIPRGQLHFLESEMRPSSRRARELLGWRPTPFEEGLGETLAFLR